MVIETKVLVICEDLERKVDENSWLLFGEVKIYLLNSIYDII